MPDLSEAELAELENDYRSVRTGSGAFADFVWLKLPRVIAEVRRLRAENAELRKRAEWRETFKMKPECDSSELRVTHEPGKEPTTAAIEIEKR